MKTSISIFIVGVFVFSCGTSLIIVFSVIALNNLEYQKENCFINEVFIIEETPSYFIIYWAVISNSTVAYVKEIHDNLSSLTNKNEGMYHECYVGDTKKALWKPPNKIVPIVMIISGIIICCIGIFNVNLASFFIFRERRSRISDEERSTPEMHLDCTILKDID